ncbi:MAG: hypothetical protein DRH90_19600 [Deltaproteobacteria bacterium]|nr:MAG: hypothetical protein DRH90_19600 [Deltaproteobacteria bacterium]RLC07696.1 MAG: hypothetical protein DRI24_24460 [Deltaproteobacteria bacterium]
MYVSHLACPKCSKTYDSESLVQLCECGSPLLVEYDLQKVKTGFWHYRSQGAGRFPGAGDR